MLVHKKSPLSMEILYKDEHGNILIGKCQSGNNEFLLCCIYGPNDDSPTFFENLFDKIQGFGVSECIICGDFNVTLRHNIDNLNYVTSRNNKARQQSSGLLNSLAQFYTCRTEREFYCGSTSVIQP